MAVLETFQGFVLGVEGDTAYLRLDSEYGDTVYAQHSAAVLARERIFEGQRFKCTVIEGEHSVSIDFAAIPPRQLSREQLQAIAAEVHADLGDDSQDDDY